MSETQRLFLNRVCPLHSFTLFNFCLFSRSEKNTKITLSLDVKESITLVESAQKFHIAFIGSKTNLVGFWGLLND